MWRWTSGEAVLVGIVSRGVSCAGKNSVGVVTRVKQHLGWIKDVTGMQQIDDRPVTSKKSSGAADKRIMTAKQLFWQILFSFRLITLIRV